MRILIIEDNQKLGSSLKRGFEQEGYAADHITDGLEGEKKILFNRDDYDIVVLDLMLPGKNGLEICSSWRNKGIMTPIIMLTAKDTVEDRVAGLDIGADDYLIKPFSFEELLSRVRALSRRPKNTLSPELTVGDLVLNPSTMEVYSGTKKIELTLKEFRLLEFFMTHAGKVVNRQQIIDHLWDFSFNPLSRVMDVHINNLRNKLESHNYGTTLETIRGIGYRLKA
jgi:DNA-binding response OmpR family regulator